MSRPTVRTRSTEVDVELARLLSEAEASAKSAKPSPSISRKPRGFRVRRSVRIASAIGPALVAAVASFTLGGLDLFAASRAGVLAVAILATALLLKDFRYPHRLLPVSRVAVALMPPLTGALVAGVLAVSGAYNLAATGLLPATALAILAALALEFGGTRYLAARPLRVAVLGSPVFAAALQREVRAAGVRRFDVVGWLNLGDDLQLRNGAMQIGTIDSIRAAVTEHELDLLVRGPGAWDSNVSRQTYQAIAEGCLGLPVRMIDGNQFYEQQFGHVPLGTIDSDWFLYLMHPNFEGTAPLTKRAFDLIGAGVAALFALPLILLGALAIKLEDRGPVFYRQIRVGEGGREYQILKLRTMRHDAEAGGAQWSIAEDDRVTRVGRVLRRTHIDELPQVINVLRGEMTLVGPRPERPEMIAALERLFPHYKQRILVKPGVTGWAQVRCGYAGSDLGSAWKLCHDLFYLKHRSMLADALIILETLAIAAKDAHRPLRAPQPEFLTVQSGLSAPSEPVSAILEQSFASERVPEIPLAGRTGFAPGAAR